MIAKKRLRLILWSAAILFIVAVALWELSRPADPLTEEPEKEEQKFNVVQEEEMEAPGFVEEEEIPKAPEEPGTLLLPITTADDVRSGETIGTLLIPSIDFQMPVIFNATAANLNRSPALMKSTQLPGEKGNAVISGHRMYEFGSHFNRLDEMKIGDEITFRDQDREFIFEVEQITIVDPAEIWIILGDRNEVRLTIFACTPIRIATHRLVVFAVLRDERPVT